MAGYRITRQQEGTRVSWWADPRGPDHGEHAWGTIIQHLGDTVLIVWDGDDEFYETWSSAEIRYRIDRGQMRLKPPPKKRRVRLPADQVCCKICGKPRQLKCGCPRPGAPKPEEWGQKFVHQLLTPYAGHDMMSSMIGGNAPDRKGAMMARRKTEAVVEDLEDLEAVEEVAEAAVVDDSDMLTAKQAASKIGTDARTLRKYLRKQYGTIGQGQRWAIDAADVDALKADFDKWAKGSRTEPKVDKAKKAKVTEPEVEADLDELEEVNEVPEVDLDDLDFDEE